MDLASPETGDRHETSRRTEQGPTSAWVWAECTGQHSDSPRFRGQCGGGCRWQGLWHLRRQTQVGPLDVSPKPVFKNSEDSSVNQDDPAGRKWDWWWEVILLCRRKSNLYLTSGGVKVTSQTRFGSTLSVQKLLKAVGVDLPPNLQKPKESSRGQRTAYDPQLLPLHRSGFGEWGWLLPWYSICCLLWDPSGESLGPHIRKYGNQQSLRKLLPLNPSRREWIWVFCMLACHIHPPELSCLPRRAQQARFGSISAVSTLIHLIGFLLLMENRY